MAQHQADEQRPDTPQVVERDDTEVQVDDLVEDVSIDGMCGVY